MTYVPVSACLPAALGYNVFSVCTLNGGINTALNSTVTKIGLCFPVQQALTVAELAIRVSSVTSWQNIKVGLQGQNANGDPDGTWLGATNNGYGTLTSSSASKTENITLGESVAVTVGQRVCVVIEWDSSAGNINIMTHGTAGGLHEFYNSSWNGSAWSKTLSYPYAALIDGSGDASYQYVVFPPAKDGVTWSSYPTVNTATTPDEMGVYFTPRRDCFLAYVRTYGDFDGPCDCVLYDSDDTVLASGALVRITGTTFANPYWYPAPPVQLNAGSYYRVVIKPTDTTSSALCTVEFDSAGMLSGSGVNGYAFTSRVDGGAWTNTTTKAIAIYFGVLDIEPTSFDFPDAANVTTDDTTNDVAGTLTLPAEADVESGVQYGGGGTEFTGTLVAGAGGGIPSIGGRVVRR